MEAPVLLLWAYSKAAYLGGSAWLRTIYITSQGQREKAPHKDIMCTG